MNTVLLADDQSLVRGALRALLELEGDIQVVAEVGRGDELVQAARRTSPEVCLVDIQMPGLDGISATRQLVSALPGVKVLILTTFNRPGYLDEALRAGAHGFVVKDSPASALAEAVRTIAAGGRVIDPALATASVVAGPNPLTSREKEVLRLVDQGRGDQDIARRLFLSHGTVRNHLSSAMGKLGADNRVHAARLAVERGWL